MNADFDNNSRIIGSLSVSIYVLGLAVGLLILSPLSEIHGREVVLNSANIWITTWQIGWAVKKQTHWIVPVLGLAPFGFGMMGIFAPIQTYVIDIGGSYAASVLAGITTARCIFGAFLPLVGPPMYASLGLGWGNALLGFIGLGLIPAPLLIVKYGGRLREKYPLVKRSPETYNISDFCVGIGVCINVMLQV
ncbi:major facilitator superfamily transporter [Colletotrichum sojae]|uniref:Major facilitator superfamily transporter n=1 Tax=Colletotrichum sojae TaxID=2175907 RepID=A0A8H6MN43_9PEZI|nr:major facilitator superfamily transporter [Colletotrichum sojae]